MAELKTKPTNVSVRAFIASIDDQQKRKDCNTLLKLMREITGDKAVMWGDTIVGFGFYHYKYASGHEGDSFIAGFSPRKQNLTIYMMSGFDRHEALLKKLGKCKTAKSCLYIKKLADVDVDVLKLMIKNSVEDVQRRLDYGVAIF
jgi:hypothetical protein